MFFEKFDFSSWLNISFKYIVENPVGVEILPSSDLKCIAILPGIGCYDDSSDSDSSVESTKIISPNSDTQFDLCGRPISNNVEN